MGEVYRATDTALGREVAIKILPQDVVNDEERLRRFEREARLLAALNHPNIAQIFELERPDPRRPQESPVGPFIVMELVEGQTLADRLASTRLRAASDDDRTRNQGTGLSVGDAVAIARQIAEALGAAHARGIVHRDIKPANIKITPAGVVKVLDFGLAKPIEAGVRDDAPTATFDGTRAGVVLGTAAYMSPEQARGLPVDTRTDIWAFGCVLYEMLAGCRAFATGTMADALVAVLKQEPDWSALPTNLPPALGSLLRRCLEKEPALRPRDMSAARLVLDEASLVSSASKVETAESAPSSKAVRGRARYVGVALAVASLAVAGWTLRRTGGTGEPVTPLLVDVRPATRLLGSSPLERTAFGRMRPSRRAIALSPDGRTIAFTAQRDGVQQLYLRALDRTEADAIPDTQNADAPFFSPDGAWIGFWSSGGLRKVPRTGGSVVKLCDASIIYGADWSATGDIFFAQHGTIWRVSENGGEATQVTHLAVEQGDARHVLPHAVPGGKWLLFTSLSTVNEWDKTRIEAQELATGARRVVTAGAADARYAPTGHLVYMRLGDLDAAPFDRGTGRLTGGEVTLVHGVMQSVNSTIPIALDTGTGQYAFSPSGALAFVTGGVQHDMEGAIEWIARNGAVEPVPAPPPVRPFFLPRLSPNGQSLIIGTIGLREQDLWRYEFRERSLTRLTTEGRAEHPLWSPDGSRLAFMSTRAGAFNVYVMRSDGGDAPVRITTGPAEFPGAWTPDGRSLVIGDSGDISIVSVDTAGPPRKLVATRFNERIPDLSPDGRWITYVSDESGASEVYVRSFPDLGNKRRISDGGGTEPAWSRNGKKLVYLSPRTSPQGRRLAVVEVDVVSGSTLSMGAPHTLFELDALHYTEASQARGYDMAPDASRFVFVYETYPADIETGRTIHYVERWFDQLRQQVPVAR